jgi:hypothetical protein
MNQRERACPSWVRDQGLKFEVFGTPNGERRIAPVSHATHILFGIVSSS